jgi:hypothetical protein
MFPNYTPNIIAVFCNGPFSALILLILIFSLFWLVWPRINQFNIFFQACLVFPSLCVIEFCIVL